jgi:DNA-binding transcriptional LysR family regulator
MAAHAPHARVVLRVSTVLNLVAAAAVDLGIAVLPVGLALEHDLTELAVGPPPETRGVWVVFHQDARQTARIKAVVEFLVADTRDPAAFPVATSARRVPGKPPARRR